MGWYFFVIACCFGAIFLKKNPLLEKGFLIFLGVFLCFGYMTGSDWRAYENYYYTDFSGRIVEPGYMLYSDFFHLLGVDFWLFHILTKVICFTFFVHFLQKYSASFYFTLMLFLASFGYYLFIDCPFRNTIAIFIFLSGIPFLIRRQFRLYLLVVLCAASFHLTALLGIVFYFMTWEKVKTSVLIGIYVFIFSLLASGILGTVLNWLVSKVPYLYLRLEAYEGTSLLSGNIISVGLILRWICLFFMCFFRRRITREFKYGAIVFSLCYTYLLFSLLAYVVPIFLRFTYYLAVFYVICTSYWVVLLKRESRYLVYFFYLGIALSITYTTCRSVFYVPYSNIIPYALRGEFPSYYYRAHYNFIHTPYHEIQYKWNE